ncbi:MAG: polysaccharide deacetylase [Candidatus Nephthysia bennettiae]|uniref:Polysaccharide deacetylase family protein n=1 Tax=Candidatus Nephthysia bennettiae TaxID=3127016 RepID=A0A934K230_9BACT|nr:polysaccharide deacetylase family protein [Candidatus Dormibacteraeota bacterium]MBJ7610959.1 polysaccharide deacetylase family protein [Candidatus Dormibacteraeota bacterium]PZR89914.1 MAG: polysaccharide deacetylase [Candidatus Dormibacteraeota bacterium]
MGSIACFPLVDQRASPPRPGNQRPSPERQEASPAAETTPAPSASPPLHTVQVPILEYHYIRTNPDPRDRLGFQLSVTPADFQAQMQWLAADGYQAVTVSDLRAALSGQRSLPANAVVLTFDDGYEDFFQAAYPVLETYHLRSVSYVVPGFFGRQGYLTPAQIVQLDQSGLVEIASHTMTHPDLTRLDSASLAVQLQASRATLEQLLGHPVQDFCYPSGRFNARVVAAVAAAGYESAATERPGTQHAWSDRLTWSRVRIRGGETLPQFIRSLGPAGPREKPSV